MPPPRRRDWRRYLPAELPEGAVAGVAGLVSDTHLPERLDALPDVLSDILAGVDVVLHAGDVGELRVLDALSAIAPVVAVHGNDDTAAAQRELPYQQIVSLAGQRIVLSHSHYPDRAEEMASRRADAWGPKLSRRATFGRRAGARIVVWGHAHIPLAVWHEGVFLVNPGALASPNYVTRQARRTVALLFVREDGTPFASHVDVAAPGTPYAPGVDLAAGFRKALDGICASILAPDLAASWEAQWERARALEPEARAPLLQALLRAARPCWRGERALVTRADLLEEVARGGPLPEAARRLLAAL
jgi:putative phosphoesterase